MRLFKKLCAFVYLAAVAVVAGGYAGRVFGPLDMQRRLERLFEQAPGSYVLLACLGIVALGTLIIVIRAFAERSAPVSVHPAGNPHIEVRLSALVSVARVAAQAEDIMVERVRARVMGHDESQVRIMLEVIAFTDAGLDALGARVQERVQTACERLLGTPGVSVAVRFLPSTTTTVTREVSGE